MEIMHGLVWRGKPVYGRELWTSSLEEAIAAGRLM